MQFGIATFLIVQFGVATSSIRISCNFNNWGIIDFGITRPSCQRQGNWDHAKTMALIRCKKQEHINFKGLVNPCFHMLPTTQNWEKIAKMLQKITKQP
jgi:hypothetical protein